MKLGAPSELRMLCEARNFFKSRIVYRIESPNSAEQRPQYHHNSRISVLRDDVVLGWCCFDASTCQVESEALESVSSELTQLLTDLLIGLALSSFLERGTKVARVSSLSLNEAEVHSSCLLLGLFCTHVADEYEIRNIDKLLPSWPKENRTRLTGRNLYSAHFAASIPIVRLCKKAFPTLRAVLGSGSLSRSFADSSSDLDLFVLLEKREHIQKSAEMFTAFGIEVDIKFLSVDDAKRENWNLILKQCISESIVLYDPIGDGLRVQAEMEADQSEIFDITQCVLMHLGNIGYPPRSWQFQEVRGMTWSVPHDQWLRRGDLLSAIRTLERACDYLVCLVFLTNGYRFPSAKWRTHLFNGLEWVPAALSGRASALLVQSFTEEGFYSVAEVLRDAIDETIDRLETDGSLADNICAHAWTSIANGRGFVDYFR